MQCGRTRRHRIAKLAGALAVSLAFSAGSAKAVGLSPIPRAVNVIFGTSPLAAALAYSSQKLRSAFSENLARISASGVTGLSVGTQHVDTVVTGGVPQSFFGSIAVPFSAIAVRGQWDRVRNQALPEKDSCGTDLCKARLKKMNEAVSRGMRRDFAGKLAIANSAVNGMIAYKTDRAIYGKLDYWASSAEILQRGTGDCEDYAILKQAMLRAMGVPDKSLSIIILKDNARGLYHAVLGVSTNQGHLILDNVRGQVFRDSQVSNYQPLFSFSGSRSWVHGTKTGNPAIASNAAMSLNNVAPGESTALPEMMPSILRVANAELRPTLRY